MTTPTSAKAEDQRIERRAAAPRVDPARSERFRRLRRERALTNPSLSDPHPRSVLKAVSADPQRRQALMRWLQAGNIDQSVLERQYRRQLGARVSGGWQ